MARYSIDELVALIHGDNCFACARILNAHRELFATAPGSSHNHQAWPGGYLDHVTEVMNIAVALFPTLNKLRPLPFSLADALLVLFLHDIEKPFKYQDHLRRWTKEENHTFRVNFLSKSGIRLTPEQKNGLTYVEGEHKDYSNERRVMGPLAAFCHICDVASARIWFDEPRASGAWGGA